MSIKLSPPRETRELKPRITVIGTGGGGCNAVNNMIRSNLEGVDFIVANTDAQAIAQSLATRKIQLGPNITQGLGAGARPEIGRAAAEESIDEIIDHLQGTHMAFITAGLGGGSGTGAAPVIAQAARDLGILTVAVVTKPFHFEGARRMDYAEKGLAELEQYVDTLIVIPNQNLFRVANERTTFADAFKMADDVLYAGVRGVTDLMVMPGLINLDFADIRTVMSEMGKAMMGTGEASGESRALDAAEAAISNPLLDDISMKGAKGVLINITGGLDMTLFEVDEAANRIREEVDPNANIIFGSTFDADLEGKMRISVVATGIHAEAMAPKRPMTEKRTVSAIAGAPSTRPGLFGAPNVKPQTAAPSYRTSAPIPQAPVARPAAAFTQPAASHPVFEAAAQAPHVEIFSDETAEQDTFAAAPAVEVDEYEDGLSGQADALAAAAIESGARAPEQRHAAKAQPKSPSFFERVSSFGRVKDKVGQPEHREPTFGNPRFESVAQAAPAAAAAQSAAASMAPATAEAADEDEDLLEIPAFLRRQAN